MHHSIWNTTIEEQRYSHALDININITITPACSTYSHIPIFSHTSSGNSQSEPVYVASWIPNARKRQSVQP